MVYGCEDMTAHPNVKYLTIALVSQGTYLAQVKRRPTNATLSAIGFDQRYNLTFPF